MTERMTEEQTLAADGDLFDKVRHEPARTPDELTAPPAETESPIKDDVELATSLAREMEEGFQIRDQASNQTISMTLEDARQHLITPSAGGHLPDDSTMIRFLKLCQAREANPWTRDVYLIGYDNKDKSGKYRDTTWQLIETHQLKMKNAENHPEYDGIESGITYWDRDKGEAVEVVGDVFYKGEPDENGRYPRVLIGGWAKVYRKDRAKPEYATARLTSYKKTKPVWKGGKPTDQREAQGYWATDESWMINKCARCKAIAAAFPNQCGEAATELDEGYVENATAAGVNDRVRIGQDNEKQTSVAGRL